ncbi:MAG: iron ABC transporter permease [Firmicutes bacterium]|nr:iron ABC transporter permease [Bacillota bacterium]
MNFMTRRNYYRKVFLAGLVLLGLIIVTVTGLGVADISWKECLLIILNKLPVLDNLFPVEKIDSASRIIVLNLRLPRIILAAMVGAGLALTGAAFQGIFKNPLAEPYLLGISSGAALGAALTMAFGAGKIMFGLGIVSVNAFIGAIGTGLIVYNIARVGPRLSAVTLLLTGTAVNILLTALISLIMTFKREQLAKIVMWTMGSVATADWRKVMIVAPAALGVMVVFNIFARDLNLILLGDDTAKSLGVEVEKVKKVLLLTATLMVSLIVSVSGVIGFVGLIVPHMIRLLFGPDHRALIPFSALGGAILMIICDTIARTIAPPNEIPVGVITAICGVPFFLALIHQNKKKVF